MHTQTNIQQALLNKICIYYKSSALQSKNWSTRLENDFLHVSFMNTCNRTTKRLWWLVNMHCFEQMLWHNGRWHRHRHFAGHRRQIRFTSLSICALQEAAGMVPACGGGNTGKNPVPKNQLDSELECEEESEMEGNHGE